MSPATMQPAATAGSFRNIRIDPRTEYRTGFGSPVLLVRDSQPTPQLLG